MKNISEFFKRIGGIQAQEMALRASIQATIKEFIDIDVPIGSISAKSGVIMIKGVAHGARTALFIHKQKIVDKINSIQSIQKIVDMR